MEKKAKKKMTRFIIIGVCVVAVVLCVFLVRNWLSSRLLDGDGMEYKPEEIALNGDSGWIVEKADFLEFYYTESSTAYPPEFQRYYFYLEDGKPMFYHEKREGEEVFLTEEHITVHGTMALTDEEWETFWSYLCKGSVKKRSDSAETTSCDVALYLYLAGDLSEYQEFSFQKPGTILSFEEFCEGLKEKQLQQAQ